MMASVTSRFDAWATDYDRYRPGYPASLFDAIAERVELPERPRVMDLGAGTGLATFAMAARGWVVTAVEPGAAMLETLRRRAEEQGVDVETVEARAEDTGLPDGSGDLGVAAQAFHWFDAERALAEMARIVRPGGGVALFWNVRDTTRSAFVADYERLIGRFFGNAGIGQYGQHGLEAEHAATRSAFDATSAFAGLTYTELSQRVEMVADDFIGMAFTASYVRNRSEEEQARFRDEVSRLLRDHDLDQRPFDVPYRIDLWTAQRGHHD